MTQPPDPPDLQKWLEKAGGYDIVDWQKWDETYAKWQADRQRYHAALKENNVYQGGKPNRDR